MGATFKQMQDDVLDECQDLTGQTDFTLTRVKRMLNRGYHQFAKDIGNLLSQSFDFTTVANQQFYTSSDVANWAYAYQIIDVKYVTETSEFGKTLWTYPGGYDNLPRNKSYGEPTYYYIFGSQGTPIQKIGTYPIIDTSSETLSVHAYHYPTSELSASGDEPLFPDEYRDAMVFYAAYRLFKNYSHLKREWRQKAFDSKAEYKEQVSEYKFNHFNLDKLPQVQDVYNDLDWLR